jgi:HSP20 family protein
MASLIRWNPLRDLMRINQNFNEYVEQFFRDFSEGEERLEEEGYCTSPPVESFRQNGSFVVKVDLPGVDPKNVRLTIEEGCLTIEGERKRAEEIDENALMEGEVCYGSFRRALSVPDGIKANQIKAKYHDGILEITAPMEEQYLPRKIEVQVEKSK